MAEKRLDLKSLKRLSKAKELGARLWQKLLLKTPYTFKKSYGSAPEPQTAVGVPSAHGPPLKI
jgi:hypothetical protein